VGVERSTDSSLRVVYLLAEAIGRDSSALLVEVEGANSFIMLGLLDAHFPDVSKIRLAKVKTEVFRHVVIIGGTSI
jgi:hypothetical protein